MVLTVPTIGAPVRQQVYDTIRQAIFDLRLRPGERLVERELVDLTGASRTSVREALRELETDGLVSRTPYRRLIVAVPTTSEVKEIYEVRGMMLGLMVRKFTEHADGDEVAVLRASYSACQSAAGTKDFQSAKDRLYDVLSAHAAIANTVMAGLSARIVFFRHLCAQEPGRAAEWVDEVGRIVDAIEARDIASADARCRDHIDGATRVVLRVLEKYPWFHRES